jgi:hypothetical protein
MADLDFQFDQNVTVDLGVKFEDIEDAKRFHALPAGSYLAEIIGFKGTRPDGQPLANTNGKRYIEVHLKLLSKPMSPPPAGYAYTETLRDRLYTNATFRYKQLAAACGKPWVGGTFQTAPYVSQRVVIDVVQRPYTRSDGTTAVTNDIERYNRAG